MLLAVLLSLPSSASAAGLPSHWHKGFNWTQWWNDAYSSPGAQESLNGLANTGANSVAFIPTYYMNCGNCTDMWLDRDKSPSDNDLRIGVQRAKAKGLQSFFRPMLDSHDGAFRGNYAPGNTDAWFASYRQFIYRYADLAQETGVEMFSVGVELSYMSRPQFDSQWRTLIAGVRARYKGKLTFGANWDSYGHVTFWDALDYIGMDAYFPLGNGATPSEADVAKAWSDYTDSYGRHHNYRDEFAAFSRRWNKPIIFNEVGYPANTRAIVEPWAWSGGTYDGDAQARAITGTLRAFADQPWFHGVYIWNWFAVPGRGGYGDTSAVVQGKPAEAAITAWFRVPAINPAPAPAPAPAPGPAPAPVPGPAPAPQPAGEDKALSKPVTASSVEDGGVHTAARAVDGDPSTRFGSQWQDNQTFQVDLGAQRSVDKVRINWEAAYASRYAIATSTDGQSFTSAAEVSIGRAGEQVTSFATRSARYVRVTALARATQYGISFFDFNVYGPEEPKRQEKAQGRTATASSTEVAELGAAKAVDGDEGSRWSSAYADDQWLQVDLGGIRKVDQVRVDWEAAYASKYRITTSTDGRTFTQAAEVDLTQAEVKTTDFAVREARYVRITAVTRGTPYGASIHELGIYGPADSPVVEKALGKPATASGVERAGLEAGKAVDGDPATRFGSAHADNQWLQVDLGATTKVDRVAINWETAYASRYRISTSTDGVTFSQAAEVAIGQAGREITAFAPRDARYVRITGITRATSYGMSIWDLEVLGPQG